MFVIKCMLALIVHVCVVHVVCHVNV
uniref:Uncharacterized protein n=1 Tax=Anguilla anguilla TaxID=7936 RepID=A0A0E9VNC9_ANGAN